ncbi:zinc-binding dehydrogenase [Alicyclobacillus cycloheptanicus]|nr:zinc-binding dehydrogenase [Alicyclobacillus cycloheptanicus]WDM02826.1 zinc-binding dehydrogenase [Alicyclobacillus cycloheptanicus]
MKAVVHAGKQGMDGVSLQDIEVRDPGAGEVRVRLKTAGLNHRDLFVPNWRQPTDPPLVLGADGAGIVEAAGPGVTGVKVGDEVIINPSLGWPVKSDAPPAGFEILGHPTSGTFGEYIVIAAENVVPKPAFLSWEEAGVLPLAALTAYRALFTRAQLKAGMTVLIPGVGSGVATFLLQFAKAVGATVYVTSRSKDKCAKALALGADEAIDSAGDWNAQLGGRKADVVIESVGAATFAKSLGQLRPGGTLVTFGASAGDEVTLNIRQFFYGQYNLLGTTMGSNEEFLDMLSFIEQHGIRPVIDEVVPLASYRRAFERLKAGEQLGKIGLRMA